MNCQAVSKAMRRGCSHTEHVSAHAPRNPYLYLSSALAARNFARELPHHLNPSCMRQCIGPQMQNQPDGSTPLFNGQRTAQWYPANSSSSRAVVDQQSDVPARFDRANESDESLACKLRALAAGLGTRTSSSSLDTENEATGGELTVLSARPACSTGELVSAKQSAFAISSREHLHSSPNMCSLRTTKSDSFRSI